MVFNAANILCHITEVKKQCTGISRPGKLNFVSNPTKMSFLNTFVDLCDDMKMPFSTI